MSSFYVLFFPRSSSLPLSHLQFLFPCSTGQASSSGLGLCVASEFVSLLHSQLLTLFVNSDKTVSCFPLSFPLSMSPKLVKVLFLSAFRLTRAGETVWGSCLILMQTACDSSYYRWLLFIRPRMLCVPLFVLGCSCLLTAPFVTHESNCFACLWVYHTCSDPLSKSIHACFPPHPAFLFITVLAL